MHMRVLVKFIACACALMILGGAAKAPPRHRSGGEAVDVTLVLAIDTSLSIADGEAGLQRKGYIQAFRDKRVINAIKGGPVGKIAVTYVEWSGQFQQRILIPWRVLSDVATSEAFATELEKAPIAEGNTTSISAALDFCVKLQEHSTYEPTRMVIDVSGDGYNDYGRPMNVARDDAVKAGITVNGLAVMNEDPSKNSAPADLDEYYRDNVIGGPGSFYLVAKNTEGFRQALVRKLVLEIAGLTAPRGPKG